LFCTFLDKERKLEMVTPKDSRRLLAEYFQSKAGILSFAQIYEFQAREEIYFGPGVNAFDVIFALTDLGKATVDFEKLRVIVHNFAPKKKVPSVIVHINWLGLEFLNIANGRNMTLEEIQTAFENKGKTVSLEQLEDLVKVFTESHYCRQSEKEVLDV